MKKLNSQIKLLAGQTAIYGIPNILARILNWLLIPIYTSKQVFSPEQYGIITEMYSYVSFLVILLLYGMENAYFKFSNDKHYSSDNVYSTILISIFTTSLLFITLSVLFSKQIAVLLHYPNNQNFVTWFALIIGLDAISSIGLAKLRNERKTIQFSFITLTNIFVNIGLNLFFLTYCLPNYNADNTNLLIETFYNPEIQVGYVFISNLIASICKFILLLPKSVNIKKYFSMSLLKKLLKYGIPLLIFGLTIIINDNLDKILLKILLFDKLGEKETLSQIGIYGACYKLSIIIVLFIQGFKYAAEPFFFSINKQKENKKIIYAKILHYFSIICGCIFLLVMLNINIIKYFIPNPDYWEGLKVVPILLFANILGGVFYNLSIWYKVLNQTKYGAYIGLIGAGITVIMNLILIPYIGYVGAAWTTLLSYGIMVIISYFLSTKKFPIPYNVVKILIYLLFPVIIYYLTRVFNLQNGVNQIILNVLLIGGFLTLSLLLEFKNFKFKSCV